MWFLNTLAVETEKQESSQQVGDILLFFPVFLFHGLTTSLKNVSK